MDIYSISETYHRALQLEKQMKKMSSSEGWNSSSRASVQVAAKPTIPYPSKPTSLGIHCFKCGEVSDRTIECKKTNRPKKTLFVNVEELPDL